MITDLVDIALFPALLLAREYHLRWEIENTLDELKTHINGRKTPIRSKKHRLVVQEIYGWLLAHWAVRCLMFQGVSEKMRGDLGTWGINYLSISLIPYFPISLFATVNFAHPSGLGDTIR